MKDKEPRKRQMLNNLLRRENWELEAIKSDNARAQRLLEQENEALQSVTDTLEDTLLELRRLQEDGAPLSIDAVQQIRLYLAEVRAEQEQRADRQRSVSGEADRIAAQLKRKLLYARGIATMEENAAGEIERRRDRDELRANEELWNNRNRKRDHD